MIAPNVTDQELEQEIKKASALPTASSFRSPPIFLTHPIGGNAQQGRRPYQEDRWGGSVLHADEGIAILGYVHDGVGGHKDGDLASSAAARAMQHAAGHICIDRPELDRVWMTEALARAAAAASRSGQGACTAVVALVRGDRALIGWLGDSRAAVVDPASCTLRWLTDDHHAVIGSGQPVLARWLGMTGDAENPIHTPSLIDDTLGPGELLMLCSDGVHGTLSNDELIELMRESVYIDDLAVSAEWVCETAIERGSTDNCTCVLITPSHATDSRNTWMETDDRSSERAEPRKEPDHA